MENNSIKTAATLVKKTDLPKVKTAKNQKQKTVKPSVAQDTRIVETKTPTTPVAPVNVTKEQPKLSFLSKIKRFLGI
jgi:hypothetical protein